MHLRRCYLRSELFQRPKSTAKSKQVPNYTSDMVLIINVDYAAYGLQL